MTGRRISDERLRIHYLGLIALAALFELWTVRLFRPGANVAADALIGLIGVVVGLIAGNRRGG